MTMTLMAIKSNDDSSTYIMASLNAAFLSSALCIISLLTMTLLKNPTAKNNII